MKQDLTGSSSSHLSQRSQMTHVSGVRPRPTFRICQVAKCQEYCFRALRAPRPQFLPFFASIFAINSASSSCSSLSILAPLLGSLPCAVAGAVGSSSPSLCSAVFSFFVLVEPSSSFCFFSSLASRFAILRSSLESFGMCEFGFPSS